VETLTPNELAELLLVASYEETEALGHTLFLISITEIAGNLGVYNLDEVIDACHLLEEKGLILLAFDHATALSASITPAGEAYVQEGGETGIIGEYLRYRAVAANRNAGDALPGGVAPIPSSGGFERATLPTNSVESHPQQESTGHIIASMEMLVRNDPSFAPDTANDIIIDIRTFELQLSKGTINAGLLDLLAAELRRAPALSPLVDLLLTMKS
jgi:hypothetical protein